LSSNITGSSVARAGGGGAGANGSDANGGGGGAGFGDGVNGAVNATENTGSGGGGGYNTTVGNGGSGVVIIRYNEKYSDIASISAGLTYTRTTPTGYKVYSFTAGTGTVTF
jgi:hypothetical protein